MKRIIIFVLPLLFFSCDPEDSRLTLINESKDSLIVRLMFNKELPNNPTNWNRAREMSVSPNSKMKFGIFNKWEGEFKRALPDTILNIIVMKHYDFENHPNKWDSILSINEYHIKKASLSYLKKKNWILKYPEDFKKATN